MFMIGWEVIPLVQAPLLAQGSILKSKLQYMWMCVCVCVCVCCIALCLTHTSSMSIKRLNK